MEILRPILRSSLRQEMVLYRQGNFETRDAQRGQTRTKDNPIYDIYIFDHLQRLISKDNTVIASSLRQEIVLYRQGNFETRDAQRTQTRTKDIIIA